MTAHHARLRHAVYRHLEPSARRGGLSAANKAICGLIVLSATFAVLETEATLVDGHEGLFRWTEWLLSGVFAVEYLSRVWISVENPKYRGAVVGRLRYMLSPLAVIDLLALLPMLLLMGGTEAVLLRAFRLLRIVRVARLGRFSRAAHHVVDAIRSRRYELGVSVCIAGLLLILSSTLLYLVEGETQPDAFGSIPRAMWWSIVTLTTVGYGDVYPVTPLGRMLAGVTAIMGIGLIAMPTGILAAAFSDALRRRTEEEGAEDQADPR
jgi:voltage-gated potassium channel